ncbi:hypothetical protein YB2330_000486 [Saitoella coloradoensis]
MSEYHISWIGRAFSYVLPVTPDYDLTTPRITAPILRLVLPPCVFFSALLLRLHFGLLGKSRTAAKRAEVWLWILGVLALPAVVGDSGSKVVNATLPMLGFLLSMRLYDLYYIHPNAPATLPLLYLHLFSFPLSDPKIIAKRQETGLSPRYRAFRSLLTHNLVESLAVAIIIRFVPSRVQDLDNMSFLQDRISYVIIGIAITLMMGASMDGWFKFCQLVSGVEMKDMFDNPWAATSPRDFWSRRWNLAIKDLFHGVIFSMVFGEQNEGKDEVTGKPRTYADAAKEQPKPKPAMSKTSATAMLIFLFSGLMHVYINFFAFSTLDLSNLAYFILQGFLCVGQVLLQKTVFRSSKYWPWWVCFLMNLVVTYGISNKLFSGVFVKYGYFEELKGWVGLFTGGLLRVGEVVWVVGKPKYGNM